MISLRHRRCFSTERPGLTRAGVVVTGVLVSVATGCDSANDLFCEESGCQFSEVEFNRLQTLSGLSDPVPDLANRLTDPANRDLSDGGPLTPAERLGQQFYHDARFSGVATQRDIAGRIVAQQARAPLGEPINISCNTCHDLSRGGTDPTSIPGNVSVGAGWYDVNSQSTLNSAHYPLKYWNGRYESLVWQITSVAESGVSMNGTRIATAWTISQIPQYRQAYQRVFGDEPLFGRLVPTTADLATDPNDVNFGQCALVSGRCPTERGCVAEPARYAGCWPRWPLTGKPGSRCAPEGAACPIEQGCREVDNACWGPVQARFERLPEVDQTSFTRIYVNWAKAIVAFEYQLTTGTTPFDAWVATGDPDSNLISPAAKRGARLFVGKAACIDCHSTPLFSDGAFHNIGVPQRGPAVPTETDVDGAGRAFADGWHRGLQIILAGRQSGIDENRRFRTSPAPAPWADSTPDLVNVANQQSLSKYPLAVSEDMRGAWRTPSLRQIAETGPYMHNGFYQSLEEVVRHYNVGGTQEGAAPERLSKRLRPLGLTDREVADLVAFLETLTAEKFLAEERAERRGQVLDLKSPPTLPPDL